MNGHRAAQEDIQRKQQMQQHMAEQERRRAAAVAVESEGEAPPQLLYELSLLFFKQGKQPSAIADTPLCFHALCVYSFYSCGIEKRGTREG